MLPLASDPEPRRVDVIDDRQWGSAVHRRLTLSFELNRDQSTRGHSPTIKRIMHTRIDPRHIRFGANLEVFRSMRPEILGF